MTLKQSYNSIDLMKFILCFLVVAIHSDPIEDVSPLLNRLFLGVERVAVPLFFIASGFFLFKGGPLDKDQLVKYLKRMGLLYFAWFVISFPITIFNRFLMGEGSLPVKLFLFVKSFFFTSTFSGSWFLASCVFCTILFYFINKWFPSKGGWLIIVFSFLVYFLCVSTSAWGNLMDGIGLRQSYNNLVFWFAKPYTSILVGIPYFALGKYIAEHENKISRPNFSITLILFALLIAEVYITYRFQLSNSTDCYLMLLPCAFCIFVYFLKWKLKLSHPVEMRKTSTIVFFSQFIWIFLIEYVEWQFHIIIPQIGKFLIAVILCLLTSFAVITLQKKRRFSWLRFFY